MERSIGLRLRVATRLTVAAIIGSAGAAFGSIGTTRGAFDAVIGGFVVYFVAFFVAAVVALEGIIVLIEENSPGGTMRASLPV